MKPLFSINKAIGLALTLGAFLSFSSNASANQASDHVLAKKLYEQHCQSCHGVDRLGAMGPALLPENLAFIGKPLVIAVAKISGIFKSE